ncbi:MAG: hypothetical protein ABI467_29815 [Kofleriaceae bacterium]
MDLALGDLVICCDVVLHPLLGDAFVICDRAGEPLTAMSALDLDHPHEIPVIAEPAKLPPGSGALLLNRIAERASGPLRYAGPYPTPALYRALARSFRASADEATFTAGVLDRAMRLARDPVAVEFTPAPHRRVEHRHGFSELRDGLIERVVLDGISYGEDGYTRLVDGSAELWFGPTRYARVATFAPDGTLAADPQPIPPLASELVGVALPAPLRAALAELVAELVPAPLARAARDVIAERTIAWADLGARIARRVDSGPGPAGFAVHAGLWQFIAPTGLAHLAVALAEALAPLVSQTIVAELPARAAWPR